MELALPPKTPDDAGLPAPKGSPRRRGSSVQRRPKVDGTRAWTARVMAHNGNVVPTMGLAAADVSTLHDLRAVEKAGTDEPAAVDKAMKAMPISGGLLSHPPMAANGRVAMDMCPMEVKSPKEPKAPADLDRVVATIPGDRLPLPAAKGGCPSTAGWCRSFSAPVTTRYHHARRDPR